MGVERNFGIVDVVERDMCIGCGACAVISNGKIPIQINPRGFFQADLTSTDPKEIEKANLVCPISDTSTNEDEIAQRYFPQLEFNEYVSRIGTTMVGRLNNESELIQSSAGGITTHLLVKLVELGLVDGVIHIKSQNSAGNGLFEYGISYTAPEVGSSRKSVYYATTLSEVLLNIANDNLTYALVGIPCFIKAGRLLVEQDERFQKKIKYFVGLVCGHLKSSFFAESLAWQAGIHPTDLGSIDFREKVRNSSSKNYGYSVESKFSTVKKIKRMAETVDGNWGLGVFQPEACNFCDDIFADTADIVFGDAWLPEYENSWEGTNIVIARNPKLLEILQSSKSREEIFLTEVPLSSVLDSQAGNIRHRRVGLQVRLEDDRKSNLRVPVKRVKPGYSNIPMLRRLLIRNRRRSSKASFQYFLKAKELNSLGYYLGVMKREKLIYNCFTYLGNPRILFKRIFSKLS